ncbi:MAG TPA: alpha/beta hydrolase [Actinomycetota bacterium]|nr:alpha/beta hydrolase [Actinomycetota bacterium]
MRQVESRDGTMIAYWTSGEGPPLVVVHGTPADHTRWQPLLPYLEPHLTVHAMDRRGRGASGDGPHYALEREFEDVAAVVDAVAEVSGSAVSVYGHSHGGLCAFGAASLTSNIGKLVLYEGWPVPDPSVFALPSEVAGRIEALLADGDRDAVVETLFRHFELMSDEDLKAFKAAPSWAGRVAAAHTITRECRAEAGARLEAAMAAKIAIPTLLVTGENSSDPSKAQVDAVVAALANARVTVIQDQEHVADVLAPELFAQTLIAFLEQ